MAKIMTPGVYINELDAFPNSVVGVQTALPAFVGYTQTAIQNGVSVTNKPILVTSLADFKDIFGTAPNPSFTLTSATDNVFDFTSGANNYNIEITGGNYNLYNSIQLFFANGGGSCYIVSVGGYSDAWSSKALVDGISLLVKEEEVTMLVCPEAILAPTMADYTTVVTAMINQAGTLQNRVCILDVYQGDTQYTGNDNAAITNFRNAIASEYLSYVAAYFPFLNTNVVTTTNFSYKQIINNSVINSFLQTETGKTLQELESTMNEQEINNYLIANSPTYNVLLKALLAKVNILPPSPAMAGVYTKTDNNAGVWKAPANVGLANVVSPVVSITVDQQLDLNSPPDGKAINAIRSFVGQGVLVWGARTMDSISNDYRYICIRRTIVYVEQSIKNYCNTFVFEPNVANTWVSVKAGIENFLFNMWKQGALVGSKPNDAYAVNVGLGSTMTAQDILNGYMNISVLVAILRPAEFIAIMIKQQLQTS